MDTPLQILGFGAIAVDEIIYVDQPLPAGKGKITQRVTAHGGNVATALVAAAKLGARVGYLGWLSEGSDKDQSAKDLLDNGVNIDSAPRHPDAKPIRSTITVGPNGDRFIAYDDDGMLRATPDLQDDLLHPGQILMIDGYAIASLQQVVRAHALGLSILGDFEWSAGAQTDQLIALCDHLVLPLGYAKVLTGRDQPGDIVRELWSEIREAVVLTDGDAGVYFRVMNDATLWHLPAFDVNAVDTTGAGDCFHGAYAVGLSRGLKLEDCVRFAAAAAALSVSGLGGRSALPDLPTVERFVKSSHELLTVPINSAELG